MFEILKSYPDNIIAIEAVGRITADDYRDVLLPEVADRLKRNDSVRMLCHLGDRFEGLSPGAAWSDLMFGVSRWNELGRLAFISDVTWIKDAVLLFAPFFHHPVRTFPNSQFDEARRWILETDSEK